MYFVLAVPIHRNSEMDMDPCRGNLSSRCETAWNFSEIWEVCSSLQTRRQIQCYRDLGEAQNGPGRIPPLLESNIEGWCAQRGRPATSVAQRPFSLFTVRTLGTVRCSKSRASDSFRPEGPDDPCSHVPPVGHRHYGLVVDSVPVLWCCYYANGPKLRPDGRDSMAVTVDNYSHTQRCRETVA